MLKQTAGRRSSEASHCRGHLVPGFRLRARELSRALQTFGRILELSPEDRGAGLARARVLSWANRFASAQAAYDSILRKAPGDRDARMGLAQVLAWSGRLDSAGSVYRGVLAERAADAEAELGLARVLAWQGRLRPAEAAWRRRLARDPDDASALVGLSQTLRWQGREAAALAAARHAARVAPTDRDARGELRWAELPLRPRASPGATWETDSDGNRISTLSAGVAFRPAAALEVRTDVYLREARQQGGAVPDGRARGASLGVRAQLEPGWWIAAGGGVGQTNRVDEDARASWRASLSSPARNPLGVMLAYSHAPLDGTALLIQRQVDVDELSLSAEASPGPGWTVAGSAGGARFRGQVSGEDNRRRNGSLSLARRLAGGFTLAASGRAFGFSHDLQDGYFDPPSYWLGEAVGRYRRERGRWAVSAELAPGVQKVGPAGSASATLRGSAGATLTLAPGRSLGLNLVYANAGLQGLSPEAGAGGYRYGAVTLGGGWAF